VNDLPKTETRQRRDCDLNPGPSALESSTLTTQLPSHHMAAVGVPIRTFISHGLELHDLVCCACI